MEIMQGVGIGMVIGLGVGWFMAVNYARARTQTELLETYRHLIEYGRPTKPKAVVKEDPATVDEIATIRIGETARGNLTEYLAREAGVSTERARQEAEKLVAHFETWGQAPTL
jgi:hypothetical protein